MKTFLTPALLLSACLFTTHAGAEATEEIIITGTRTQLTTDKLAASTSVLDREDIAALQVKSLPDLLQGLPGVDVTVSGGYGKTTSVRMRGTESDHVLVLVDGIRVGSATTGTSAFQHIPVTQIERIELVRGPRSSVWGSEALGGVIHIITRKGSGEPRYDLELSAGSNSTYEVTAGTSGAYNNFHYSGTVSYFDSAGIDSREPTSGPFGVDQPDADGYDNTSIHLRGGYYLPWGGEIEGFILRAEGMTEFDSGFENRTEYLQQTIGIMAGFTPMDNWTTKLKVGESRDEADNLALDGGFSSNFDTSRLQLSWQNEIALGDDHELSLGLDYRDDEVGSTNDYGVSNRDNLGIYGQYHGNFNGHQLIASVRRDEDEVFGGETTGGIGWSYIRNDWLRIYAAYGTAYKTPTFNELFFPGFGNPDLGPESAVTYEAGIEGEHDWLHWGLHAYRSDLEDLIVTVANPAALFGFAPDNVGAARIIGLEAELTANWRNWVAELSAELLDPEDESTGNRLPRRVRQRLTLDLMHHFDNWSVGGRLLMEGDRFDDAGNTIRVGGYTVVDLRADYRFNDQITLRAKAGNLFDEYYHTIDTYRSLGRNVFLTFHYRSR